MKRDHFRIGVVGLVIIASMLVFVSLASSISAQEVSSSDITIHRFKVISGSQYVELRNHTAEDIDMSNVQLAYYNDYDLSKATSSKLISLTGVLPANGFYLINDSALTLCYQTAVASASLGFSTSSGRIQLLRLLQTNGNPANPFEFSLLDHAGWYRGSATPPVGIVKFPATSASNVFALRQWQDASTYAAGSGGWLLPRQSVGDEDKCTPYIDDQPLAEDYDDYIFLPSVMPAVRYVAAVSSGDGSKSNRNPGKMAPLVNEVLPNPASPQTDADDEFIELYNPNDSAFDLSGFKLAFGGTSPRKFTFPEGTVLQAKEFKVFTSGDTSISLSNTEAQVWLLDPNEKVVSQSDPYSKAKDGHAWVLNNGKWAWSSMPSPNQMNTLSPDTTGAGATKTVAAVLGINASNSSGSGNAPAASTTDKLEDKAPLHPLVLAGVGLAALAYAVYEYRQDLSNRIFQFRRNHANRRALREKMPRG